jgi:hypothetical protein
MAFKLFKLIKYKIVVFDEEYILFHFNIILKQNRMSSTKTVEIVLCAFKDPEFV